MERVVATEEMSNVVALAISLLTLPQTLTKPKAFIFVPGLIGEEYRVIRTIERWEETPDVPYLLIPGHIKENPLHLSIENLQLPPFNLKRTDGVICTPYGENTKIQAEWCADLVEKLRIDHLRLFTAPFHLLRSYLTFLKSFLSRSLKPIMIPEITTISPFWEIAVVKANGWQLISSELQRIRVYQEKGDVATYKECKDYLAWLWSQIPTAP